MRRRLSKDEVDLYFFVRRGMLVSQRATFPMIFQYYDELTLRHKYREVTLEEYVDVYTRIWNPWLADKSKGKTI